MNYKISVLILLFPVFSFATPEQVQWNQKLIQFHNSENNKRDRTDRVPSEITSAASTVNAAGIKTYQFVYELAQSTDLTGVILHEYFRKQSWGMPWLPLTWETSHRDAEGDYALTNEGLEKSISAFSRPMLDDNMLISYLLVGSVFHSAGANLVNSLRYAAAKYAESYSDFYDIRREIHQEPSLRTLARVEEYEKGLNSARKTDHKFVQIITELRLLFGGSSVDDYLMRYSPTQKVQDAMRAAQATLITLSKVNNPSALTQALPHSIESLIDLGNSALDVSNEIRTAQASKCNMNEGYIDCGYEKFDLLRQIHTLGFSLGNSLQEKISSFSATISVNEAVALLKAYLLPAISIGIVQQQALGEVKDFENSLAQKNNIVTLKEFEMLLSRIESVLMLPAQRIKGIFAQELEKYKAFIPQADTFIDDTLHSTTLIPLSNLIALLLRSTQKINGTKIWINHQPVTTSFRVLNPGIAHGRLVILSEKDSMNEDYHWDAEAVYILPKTPAGIRKVAGIITCDSGSIISHVNLLAGNHGIPNVYITCSLLNVLKSLQGQDVFIATLGNGEAIIKPWISATPEEVATYNDYNKIKSKHRVHLSPPEELDINYPMKLEQLRIAHTGKRAGGKACGQGELASVFKDTVPPAIVLPFGVYFEHVKDTGLYKEMQEIFSSQDFKGNSEANYENRKQALKYLRDRLQNTELKPSLMIYLNKVLRSHPFVDKGLYVRSDTNAEDLPGFVGAGLNETLGNVKNEPGLAEVFKAIKTVWSSPFKETAFAWRQDLIDNPWDIFPSVLIQVGINADKMGVMVVGDTITDDQDDTVILAANEGLGFTTVNGEFFPEELKVFRKSNTIQRLRRAYAPTKKAFNPKGGVQEVPVAGLDPVIEDSEALQLAAFGDRIQKHMETSYGVQGKWDLEWGILNKKIYLVQIRPFVGNKIAKNVASLKKLESKEIEKKVLKIPSADKALFLEDIKK